jgi:hypothetical protein
MSTFHGFKIHFKSYIPGPAEWLTPVILATQEAKVRRIAVQSQSWANSLGDPILKRPITKKTLVEWLKV